MEHLLVWDYNAALFINQNMASPFLDFLMPLVRNKIFWAPLYIFLFSFLVLNFKKKGWLIILFIILTIGVADQLSSHVLKPWVHRLRPCNDPQIHVLIRHVVNCGKSFSFPSSHAVNHFALAFFLIGVFPFAYRWLLPLGVIWAGLICFAQVYVGVHYPIDVIFGAFLGALLGFLFGDLTARVLKLNVYSSE